MSLVLSSLARTRVRVLLFKQLLLFLFNSVRMEDSVLSLVILNGFVYPVRKDEVEDLIENFSD